MERAKTVVIILLAFIVVWMASAVIRLEQFHYATMLNDCPAMQTELDRAKWLNCIQSNMGKQRTSPIYDLAYGLGIL